jgi:hypothetical protein
VVDCSTFHQLPPPLRNLVRVQDVLARDLGSRPNAYVATFALSAGERWKKKAATLSSHIKKIVGVRQAVCVDSSEEGSDRLGSRTHRNSPTSTVAGGAAIGQASTRC